MKYQMRLNGKTSTGYIALKSGKIIFRFGSYGKCYWSGDGINLRNTKKEAYGDTAVQS
jgi:hypothetical protein